MAAKFTMNDIRKSVLIFSLVIAAFTALNLILKLNNLYWLINPIEIFQNICSHLILLCPFIWLTYIKQKYLKLITYIAYLAPFVIMMLKVGPFLFSGYFFTFRDIINSRDIVIYEANISETKKLVVYDTGSYFSLTNEYIPKLTPAVIGSRYGLVETREYYLDRDLFWNYKNNSGEFRYNGIVYTLPNPSELQVIAINKFKTLSGNREILTPSPHNTTACGSTPRALPKGAHRTFHLILKR